ncbi:MAG: ATP-binding protein [Deltaproteobacteria bacterium]
MPEFKSKLDTEWLSQIADFVEETAKKLGCADRSVVADLKLAVDEACTNIMTHGKGSQKKDYLTVRIEKAGNYLDVEIIDHGKPYAFEKIALPDPNLPVEEKLKAGFGVGLIKAVTENPTYRAFSDRNVLYFRKRIDAAC